MQNPLDDDYLTGKRLYGDDLGPSAVAAWVAEEREAYAGLGAKRRATYRYPYRALDHFHLLSKLHGAAFRSVLGIGSAYGEELRPLAKIAEQITIVEASHELRSDRLDGTPLSYVDASDSGDLPFSDESFDLTVCLSTLHHVPNVSHLVGEIARCLAPAGYVLLREPVISMGDWRSPRPNLTQNERGIPLDIFRRILREAGLGIRYEGLCEFSLFTLFARLGGGYPFNNMVVARVDSVLSTLFAWNLRYHAASYLQKVRPTAVCVVAQKAPPHPMGTSLARTSE